MKSIYRIIAVVLVVGFCTSQSVELVPNRKFNILSDVVEMQMSPNGEVLGCLNHTHTAFYNPHNGYQLTIQASKSEPLTLSFARSSRLVAIGYADGNIQLFQIKYDTQINIQLLKRYKPQMSQGVQNFTRIVGACFSSDDEAIVYADNEGVIIRWVLEGEVATTYFSGARTSKVACSQSDPYQFIVGGDAMQENKTAKLKIFAYNNSTQLIQFKKSLNTEYLEYINFLAYHPQDNSIYVLSDQSNVRVYETPQYNDTIFYQGHGEMFKLILGKTDNNFAVVNSTHIILSQEAKQKMQNSVISYYGTNTKTMAMNRNGNRLLYVDANQKTNALDTCAEGAYYDAVSDSCKMCETGCTVCTETWEHCHECKYQFYISGYTCLKCMNHCQICSSSQTCQICTFPFVSINGQCQCEQGYLERESNCVERGLQFWAFVLIVGSFCLILCLVTVVNLVIMRRNQTRKHMLLDDH